MSDHAPSFGHVSAPAVDPPKRDRFRIAIFGDFSGRAAKGLIETGEALASRRAIVLDVDTFDDVIEDFATTLVLPIGKDGTGLEIELDELEDLHPDELYESVEIFEALSGLRQRLDIGSMAEKAVEQLQGWGEAYGTKIRLPKRSASNAVPADKRLSDFQALIGDTRPIVQASPVDDLIARVIGPHIVATPDPGVEAMQEAIDEALSSAMRMILHHPDLQAVEAQWRSLDLLARNIETDEALEVVLYDISAEEIAADLAAHDDLAQSGLFNLLRDAAASGRGAGAKTGGFSALFGMYTFEDTPPHAELLGRVAKVAAHVDAPFFTAISPGFLDQNEKLRHPLVVRAWNQLRALPEAEYLGVVTPRFMLRRPYGSKSDPISAFKFEEFTSSEGLSGMLWANPVVLVAILLAKTWSEGGEAMQLGRVMSLGDIPFHLVNDRYGDQVALPCTERNLNETKMEAAALRGIIPVLSMKGRDEIRLASFMSVGRRPIAGRWSDPDRVRPEPEVELEVETATAAPEAMVVEDVVSIDPVVSEPETVPATEPKPEEETDTELDDLLASFGDDENEDAETDDNDTMDAELAALLEDL